MPETPSKFPAMDEKRACSAIRPSKHISLQQAVTTNTEAAISRLRLRAAIGNIALAITQFLI